MHLFFSKVNLVQFYSYLKTKEQDVRTVSDSLYFLHWNEDFT